MAAGEAGAGEVGGKGRLDVHQIHRPPRCLGLQRGAQGPPVHQAVFRIEGQASRRHGMGGAAMAVAAVVGGDQRHLDTFCGEVAAEGVDGGGDAVDAGKEHVRNHQDVEGADRAFGAPCFIHRIGVLT